MVKDDFSGAENRSFGAKIFRSQKFSIGGQKKASRAKRVRSRTQEPGGLGVQLTPPHFFRAGSLHPQLEHGK